MQVSKYLKVDRNVLIEYIYDDSNLIGENYKVLVNTRDNTKSFMSGDLSSTNNIQDNQLFELDKVNNKYGLVDTNQYSFLQTVDHSGGLPIRHDRVRFHFPINYTFEDKIGFYFKLYTFDFNNKDEYSLSNFFFDITDVNTQSILNYTSPAFVFQETLWGKYIEVSVPSVYSVALQRDNGNASVNSINGNLTNNFGLSTTAPVFIDFNFLASKQTINNVDTYILGSSKTVSVPQVPEFENLSVTIKNSDVGDYYEIFGTFNDSIGGFADFISKSKSLGHRYFVEYLVTQYEENIKGKTVNYTVTDDFGEPIEHRPIIKFSTTTAVLDVEMRLIDAVDNSVIFRRASYGMLSNEVAKYSLKMNKININNANKPKIYNRKGNFEQSALSNAISGFNKSVQIEQVRVPYPVFHDKSLVVAKSDSVKINNDTFYGNGKLQIVMYPFDNVITIMIAKSANEDDVEMMDLNNGSELKIVFKNDQLKQEGKLFTESEELDLGSGVLVFRVDSSQIPDIRKIFNSGRNVFYITSTPRNNSITTIVYSGTYMMYDSLRNVSELNEQVDEATSESATPTIIEDRDIALSNREFAIVTRRRQIQEGVLRPIRTALSQNINTAIRRT